jgi:transposase InsO family protein
MAIKKTKTTKKELANQLGISISSLYYKPKRDQIDNEVKSQIEAILTDNPSYGHKRIALALKLNKKRILRVMHKFNIKPYRRRRRRLVKQNDLNKPATKYDNLIENLAITKPHQVWVSDFTYIKWQNRFIYLATIIDVYSRYIVGFNVSRFHNKELVIGALEDALTNHPKPEFLHSDQGSEYDSQTYTSFCEQIGIQISMSRKSSPWENGYQESFYSHFKVDLADVNRFDDIAELVEEINYQIWYYNNKRIHGRIKTTPKIRLESHYKLLGT